MSRLEMFLSVCVLVIGASWIYTHKKNVVVEKVKTYQMQQRIDMLNDSLENINKQINEKDSLLRALRYHDLDTTSNLLDIYRFMRKYSGCSIGFTNENGILIIQSE